jgi:hypothetical protein
VLTQWQELFRTGLLAWGHDLNNPTYLFSSDGYWSQGTGERNTRPDQPCWIAGLGQLSPCNRRRLAALVTRQVAARAGRCARFASAWSCSADRCEPSVGADATCSHTAYSAKGGAA